MHPSPNSNNRRTPFPWKIFLDPRMELSIINPFRSMYTMYLQICLLSRIRSTVLRRQAIEYRPTIMCKEHVFYTFSWYVHCLYVQVLNVQCNMDGIYKFMFNHIV